MSGFGAVREGGGYGYLRGRAFHRIGLGAFGLGIGVHAQDYGNRAGRLFALIIPFTLIPITLTLIPIAFFFFVRVLFVTTALFTACRGRAALSCAPFTPASIAAFTAAVILIPVFTVTPAALIVVIIPGILIIPAAGTARPAGFIFALAALAAARLVTGTPGALITAASPLPAAGLVITAEVTALLAGIRLFAGGNGGGRSEHLGLRPDRGNHQKCGDQSNRSSDPKGAARPDHRELLSSNKLTAPVRQQTGRRPRRQGSFIPPHPIGPAWQGAKNDRANLFRQQPGRSNTAHI